MADMTYRPLGSSGLMVSTVGLGCNAFGRRVDLDGTRAVVDAALDAGVTLFDTADIYGRPARARSCSARRWAAARRRRAGHQVRHGHARRQRAGLGRARARGATSAGPSRPACAGCGTDHIDLYQLHRPDPVTPIEETLAALTELVHEGKVRYIGCSNFAGWQVVDADWTARTRRLRRFVSRAERVLPARPRRRGRAGAGLRARSASGMLPYFPLAYGLLTGKYRRGEEAPDGHAALGPSRAQLARRAPTGTGSRRWRRSPTSAGLRCWTWPSAASPPSRRWRR